MFPHWQSPSVPKITVNEDRYFCLRENNVGRSLQSLVVSVEMQALLHKLTLY
jgi:hypothetical protein